MSQQDLLCSLSDEDIPLSARRDIGPSRTAQLPPLLQKAGSRGILSLVKIKTKKVIKKKKFEEKVKVGKISLFTK